MTRITTLAITRAALIAALYTALTLICAPIAFGPVQFRPAEALTILPLFFIEAIPGLAVGCLASNLFSQYGAADIGIGTAATLAAAVLTWLVRGLYLGVLPPIILNALLVPVAFMLAPDAVAGTYLTDAALVGASEALTVLALGIPLYFGVRALLRKSVFTPTTAYWKRRLASTAAQPSPAQFD
jgi:uncharacterized membrane protein